MQAVIQEQKAIRRDMATHKPPDQRQTGTTQDVQIGTSRPLDTDFVGATPSQTYVTLPGGARISEKTANAARKGEYVNLTDFLPAVDHTRVDRDMEPSLDNSGKLLFRTKHIRKSLDNIAMWQSAWNNYEYLLVLSVSSRYAEMNKYRDFIQKCSQKFQWYAVHAYDCRFRAQAAHSDSDLATTDTDLCTSVLDITAIWRDVRTCHRCKSI